VNNTRTKKGSITN